MILLSQKHAAPPAVHQWDFLRPPEDLRSDWLPLFPHHSTLTGGYCCSAANSMVHISDWSENRSSTQTHITWNRSTLAGKDLYIYKYITHTHTQGGFRFSASHSFLWIQTVLMLFVVNSVSSFCSRRMNGPMVEDPFFHCVAVKHQSDAPVFSCHQLTLCHTIVYPWDVSPQNPRLSLKQ